MKNKYRYLKHGEIIQEGDEVDIRDAMPSVEEIDEVINKYLIGCAESGELAMLIYSLYRERLQIKD